MPKKIKKDPTEVEVIQAVVIYEPPDENEETLADFDDTNPRSLINLLPSAIQVYVQKLPARYFEVTDDELKRTLFGDEKIEPYLEQLRVSFWDEYDRVQKYEEKQIDIRNVCSGICPERMFWKRVVPKPGPLTWILRPPTSYEVNLKEIHQLGMRAMKRIMSLDAVSLDPLTGTEKPDTRLAEVQFKILQHVDMRHKGAIIQRIQQQNLNVHMDGGKVPTSKQQEVNQITKPALAEVESKIADLQRQAELMRVPATNRKVDLMPKRRTQSVTELAKQKDDAPDTMGSNEASEEALQVPGRPNND